MSAVTAQAVPFTVSGILTGDFRAANPDNLLVNVTVSGDTTSNQTAWAIDLNSPAHPNATLDEFFFNLMLPVGVTASFSNFSLDDWISTSGTNANGSGSADFALGTRDQNGAPHNPVTNATNLSFNLTLSAGTWNTVMLTSAPLSTGGGIPGAGAQMGAHIQSLSTAGCTGCSDSGFASGNFGGNGPGPVVPEPTTLVLLGSGLLTSTLLRKRAKRD